jgi:hypothetical protein
MQSVPITTDVVSEKQQEDSLLSRMKMFVQLRQDLERVITMCYILLEIKMLFDGV